MKILLLGGTGAMGIHLAEILSKENHKVVITSRKKHEARGTIIYREGNAKDLEFIKNVLMEEWDAIVDFMIYTENEFRERSELLLKSTGHYIFLSSSRVYNKCNGLLNENSNRLLDSIKDVKFLKTSEYSLNKARQEDILFSSGCKNWTIIRPYITYSNKRLQLGTLEKEDWLYRALNNKTIVFSEDMKRCVTTLTYGFDVANGIASIISRENAFGETYHITNNYSNEWNEILDIYLDTIEKKLGKRPKVVFQNLSDFKSWNPSIYQIKYDRLFDRKFDNTKINESIDTKNFITVENGLRACMNDFIEDPEFLSINWKKEAIKDKFCGEKTPLKSISGLKQKFKYLRYRYL